MLRRRRALGGAIVGAMLCAASSSAAADGDAGTDATEDGDVDVAALVRQLEDEHAALATSDCDAACRALGSIQRAANKICALEPGPRCDAARSKAADATRRVQEACPTCDLAAMGERSPEPRAVEARAQADAPPSAPAEAPRGGCRSCSTADGRGGLEDLGLLVLAAFGALRLVDRRARARRR